MSSLEQIGEFGFIEKLRELHGSPAHGATGIGDDCAILPFGDSTVLVSTDAFAENVHFRRDWATPYQIGRKAASAALSDIAAMGGEPRFVLASVALPGDVSEEDALSIMQGVAQSAESVGASLVGGDTTRSESGLMLDVTVLGVAPCGRVLKRSGARKGDMLLITGTPGRSRAGLIALERGLDMPTVIEAHLNPASRMVQGKWFLANPHVRAMMDVSDGIAQDAGHLARASGLGVGMTSASVAIDPELLPICMEIDTSIPELVFAGGEDYELAVVVDPAESPKIIDAFRREFNLPIYAIGTFTDQFEGVRIDGAEPGPIGFDHFRPAT